MHLSRLSTFLPFEYPGRHPQVFQPAVGAAADHHLVDRDVAYLADGPGIGGQMREGHLRLNLGSIVLDHLRVCGIRDRSGTPYICGSPVLSHTAGSSVDVEEAGLAAGFDGHIGHGETAVHGQGVNRLAGELHGGVERAVHADFADGIEDQVLAAHPFA